ncbi:MAG: secondary thiamine-phosphate synthase enzyme YjbQ [Bacteroidales bacterium]
MNRQLQIEIRIGPFSRGIHLVTEDILSQLGRLPSTGLLHLFIQHTSAGLTINENADLSVRHDMQGFIDEMVPEQWPGYTHTIEGPDDMPAHIKASLLGSSVSIPITNHMLNMGVWQGIYLGEFRDKAGPRSILATIIC